MSIAASNKGAGGRSATARPQASTEEWELRLGEQFRSLRLNAGLDQRELAESANVSIGALRTLERGTGSSVRTLIRVARVLGQEDWLTALAPAPAVSPIDVLRNARAPRVRVYRPRKDA